MIEHEIADYYTHEAMKKVKDIESDSTAMKIVTDYFYDIIRKKELRQYFKHEIFVADEVKQLTRITKIINYEKRDWQKHFSDIPGGLIRHIAKELAWKIALWEVRQ